MNMMTMDEAAVMCLRKIAKLPKHSFVAVTGDSGSGKSFLVDKLTALMERESIKYERIDHDEFLVARADREPLKQHVYESGPFAGKTYWEVLENMFRLDEYGRVIDELRAGREAAFKPYRRETGNLDDVLRTVRPADIILFDTSMLLDKMDYVILVDVDQSVIIERKLKRDSDIRTPDEIRHMHEQVQGYYWIDRGRPNTADIIIDNNDSEAVSVTVRTPGGSSAASS